MSTRSPRNGTPSASSRRRWRSPFASDPSARTMRCHGHVGVVAGGEHGAREARRARGDVAVGAHEARRGVADAAQDGLLALGHPGIVARSCATGRTRSSPSTPRPASTARPCTRTGSRSARSASGRARASGRSRRSPWSSPPTARTGSTAWRRATTPAAALAGAARRRRAGGGAPGRDRRRRRRVAVHTGADCIPCAGDATGAHVSAQANMMARDTVPAAMVAGFEAASGDLAERLMAALRRRGGRGRRRARPPVRGAGRGAAARASRGRRASSCASRTTRSRSRSCGRLLRLARAYELAGEADELMASDRAGEAGPLYLRRGRAGAGVRRAAVLGRAGAGPRRRRPDRDGRGPARDRAPPGLADAARAALAGLRPRGGARPARAWGTLTQGVRFPIGCSPEGETRGTSRSPAGGTRSGCRRRRARWPGSSRPARPASGRWRRPAASP